MRGNNWNDVTFLVKLQFIDAHLTIEAMDGFRIVVAVIDDVILAIDVDDGVVTRAMHRLIFVGGEEFALIFEGSHWSYCRRGVLHTISVGVARA